MHLRRLRAHLRRARESDAGSDAARADAAQADAAQADAAPRAGGGVHPALDAGPPGDIVLTSAQATCLGLDEPTCAACHRRGDAWYLRPLGVGAQPGELPLRAPAECDIERPAP